MKKPFPIIPLSVLALLSVTTWAQVPPPEPEVPNLASLKTIPPPQIPGIEEFVKDTPSAERLGKALFWDMQVGSDVQACASCHFHAGADNRKKNQLSPGLLAGDTVFGNNPFTALTDFPQFGPNYALLGGDFPFRKLSDPNDRNSAVLEDTNDVVSSQGVFLRLFTSIRNSTLDSRDNCTPISDPVFNVAGETVRRVEPRNTPTTINAVFNLENFWDGRASHFFNGVNPFGALDQAAKVHVNRTGILQQESVRLPNSSLASQAVGPPLSEFEMSCRGRTFAELGKKMRGKRPLQKQLVHPQDSILGPYARARLGSDGTVSGFNGLTFTAYADMIKAAFNDRYWNSTQTITVGGKPFNQMEANFPLFFGIAVMMYERRLVADDSRFDRFMEGNTTALTAQEQNGLAVFTGKGKCANCHGGAELTNASITNAQVNFNLPGGANNIIEHMLMGDGNEAIYDNGFYNIGVRPTAEDIGRGGTAPFVNPLTGQPFPLSFVRLAELKAQGLLPAGLNQFVPDLPPGIPANFRVAVDGAIKAPGLRNAELTGPYFHHGGMATLRQVVDFYNRGGNFRELNSDNLDPDIDNLLMTEQEKTDLVAFLLTLTDERVRNERGPFDHPQLFIPNGQLGDGFAVMGDCDFMEPDGFSDCDTALEIPPIGAGGRSVAGLPPIGRFLGLDPFSP